MQMFQFALPIGWQELSAIATTIAVVVALWANRKTTVQMKDTLRAQEQSKNIELFDKRVKIIHNIETDQEVSDLEVQLLFSDQIVAVYREFKELKLKKYGYNRDLDTYKFLIEEACINSDEPSPLREIAKAKWMMEQSDFSQDTVAEYESICKENEVSTSYGSYNDEWRTYNYKTISDSIHATQGSIDDCKTKLVTEMTEFVRRSIDSLVKKGI